MCVCFFHLLQGEITITYNRIEPPKGRGMDIGMRVYVCVCVCARTCVQVFTASN